MLKRGKMLAYWKVGRYGESFVPSLFLFSTSLILTSSWFRDSSVFACST